MDNGSSCAMVSFQKLTFCRNCWHSRDDDMFGRETRPIFAEKGFSFTGGVTKSPVHEYISFLQGNFRERRIIKIRETFKTFAINAQ